MISIKLIKTFFLLLLSINVFSQYENEPNRITPAIEKRINNEIKLAVDSMKLYNKKTNELDDILLEFTIDTFKIERYAEKRMEIDYTTPGMKEALYDAAQKYDTLLNVYYQRILKELKPNDKKTLIQAQKNWLVFRDNELKLLHTIEGYSSGGTIQGIINASFYLDLIKNRAIAIFNHYHRINGGY